MGRLTSSQNWQFQVKETASGTYILRYKAPDWIFWRKVYEHDWSGNPVVRKFEGMRYVIDEAKRLMDRYEQKKRVKREGWTDVDAI